MKNITKLIPIKKTITHKKTGKSFQRTYYILPNKNNKIKQNNKNNIEKNILININANKEDINFVNNNIGTIKDIRKRILEKSNNNSFEYFEAFKMENNKIINNPVHTKSSSLIFGDSKSIYFEPSDINKIRENTDITVHNHPSDAPFSVNDLMTYFTSFEHDKGIVVGKKYLHYVDISGLDKNKKSEILKEMKDRVDFAYKIAHNETTKQIKEGKMKFPEEKEKVNEYYGDRIFYHLINKYNIRYLKIKLT